MLPVLKETVMISMMMSDEREDAVKLQIDFLDR